MAKFKAGDVVKYMNDSFSVQVTDPEGTMKKTFRGVVIETDGMWPIGYKSDSWANNSFDLTPIDPPRTVLTDWQRKQLGKAGCTDAFINHIESILSEPEPPKYEPKEGESVLYPQAGVWCAGVFENMINGRYRVASSHASYIFDKVIPFDSDMHGKLSD